MTSTRSLIASTSGRSDEIRMIAIPEEASSSTIWWTSAFAPTSIPRVGSSRISTLGWAFSHFASIIFCWLPPERCSTGVSSDGVRIVSFWRKSSATARSADAVEQPQPGQRTCAASRSVMFAVIDCGIESPSCRRSSER